MHRLGALVLAAVALPGPCLAQWTYGSSGTTAELRGLSPVNRDVVWASGARGTVVRSLDGGRTWTADTVAGMTALDFRAIHAFDARAAVMASAGEAEKGLARIVATRDAGRSWASVFDTDRRGVFLDAVAFWDARHGVALSDPVDSAFFLLLTSDAGRSWTRVPPAGLPRVLPGEAAFAASGSSIAVHGSHVWIGTGGGGRARVMHSPDRGRTWAVTDVPVHATGPAAGIFSLAFFDARHGVAAGGDYTQPRLSATSVAITSDGGRTWRAAPTSPSAYLSGIAYAGSRRRLVAVGLAGTYVSNDGATTWTHLDTVPLNAVRFRGKAGFAVGPRGRVARWNR